MDKIVGLARKNGSDIVFATAPVANPSLAFIKDYGRLGGKVSKMASELGVPYLDFNLFNLEGDVFQDSNFRDDAHLNYSGVLIADEIFADWLRGLGLRLILKG
jgi:hypothetical protein